MPDSLPDVPVEMLEQLGNAVEGTTPVTPVAPAEPAAPGTGSTQPEAPAAPEGAVAPEAATAPDSFTKLDPNTLPPEVRPYYDSMHADYIRKTQEASPWRKLGAELGVDDPAAIRDAVEVYTRLQDENALREFVSAASQVLGLGQPAAPAATDPAAQGLDLGLGSDPELQTALSPLEQRLASLEQELARRDAQAEAESMQWALLGEVNRQEALLKDQHPEWGASDGEEMSPTWEAIWNMSVATNGDLVSAARIIEQAQNAHAIRLLQSKTQVAHTEGIAPPAPAAIQTPPVVPEDDPELKGPTKAAIEYLRGLVNTSE